MKKTEDIVFNANVDGRIELDLEERVAILEIEMKDLKEKLSRIINLEE